MTQKTDKDNDLLIKYLNKIYTSIAFWKEDLGDRDCFDNDYACADIKRIQQIEGYFEIARGAIYEVEMCDLESLSQIVRKEIDDHKLMIQGLKADVMKKSEDMYCLTCRIDTLEDIYAKSIEGIKKDREKNEPSI